MHMFQIPQYIIQNRNVHTSVMNDALGDMVQEHCEIGLFHDSLSTNVAVTSKAKNI